MMRRLNTRLRRSPAFSCAMLAGMLYCLLMPHPSPAAEVLLQQEFRAEGTLPSGWDITKGDWRTTADGLKGSTAGAKEEATILFGDKTWKGVAVEADITLGGTGSGRTCGIVARVSETAASVRLALRIDGKGALAELALRKPGGAWRVVQAVRLVKYKAGPCKMALEVGSPWVRAFVNGERVMQVVRADELSPDGRAGLFAGTEVTIRSVTVRPVQPEPVGMSVQGAPLVIAHRGASYIAPENTLVAYRKAMETCADMAECDTYLTKDGVPILLHDGTFLRTAGLKKKPGELTLAEVKKLDAGSWKSPEYKGEPVPTLREALDLTKGHLRLVIEIKERKIEKQVLEAIRASGTAPEDVMIFSFLREAVDEIARQEPLLPTTWLLGDLPYDREARKQLIRDALSSRVSAIGSSLDHVDPEIVRMAHSCGLSVFIWTVDEPEDMRYMAKIGVDGIITNRPDVLCGALGALPSDRPRVP